MTVVTMTIVTTMIMTMVTVAILMTVVGEAATAAGDEAVQTAVAADKVRGQGGSGLPAQATAVQ
jgi:hypothetical protein